ncbi:MAG: nucleotidyltransferase family protein [Casimicrobiaceae bacterium]
MLLAAGRGVRFGADKLLAPLPAHGDIVAGTPLAVAACRHLLAAIPTGLAVVRPGADTLAAQLAACGVRVVPCPSADLGMGASLACGIAASSDADGWVIALADMPWIAAATIRAVADALAAGAGIAVPVIGGLRGHPVGFAREFGATLRRLGGDQGAKAVLAANAHAIRTIEVEDRGILRDIDVPGDLLR